MLELIADSGSTKTHWALVDSQPGLPKTISTFTTQGLNPLHVPLEQITTALRQVLDTLCGVGAGHATMSAQSARLPQLLRFYGSGCTPAMIPQVEQALRKALTPMTQVRVASDLVGAAQALAGQSGSPFIACIMGTGSIAALYQPDSQQIHPMPALGYILGDEGSGGWFGRQLLADYLKGQLPERVEEAFEEQFGTITPQSAIQHVYQQPCPNRYLATFASFVGEHLDLRYCEELAYRGIDAFWRRNVMRCDELDEGRDVRDVRLVGSVAWALRKLIQTVAESHGYVVTQVIKDPIQGLV